MSREWKREGGLIYSLMGDGFRRGVEQFKNEVAVSVCFDRSVDEAERERIMLAIKTALEVLP